MHAMASASSSSDYYQGDFDACAKQGRGILILGSMNYYVGDFAARNCHRNGNLLELGT